MAQQGKEEKKHEVAYDSDVEYLLGKMESRSVITIEEKTSAEEILLKHSQTSVIKPRVLKKRDQPINKNKGFDNIFSGYKRQKVEDTKDATSIFDF